MMHSPFTPFRNAFIRDLKDITDEELLELFYTGLRWVNYFEDEDNLFVYLKIFQDVYVELKRRGLKYSWTNEDIKKYRILGQKMYYGSLSVKELEWRLGFIIMHAIPLYRNVVRSKLYLVRERIHIIIESIHQQYHWTELEYNKDLLEILDVPFFSFDNFSDMCRILKAFFLLNENIFICFLFILYTLIRQVPIVWPFIDPDYRCLKNILRIVKVFVVISFISCYMHNIIHM